MLMRRRSKKERRKIRINKLRKTVHLLIMQLLNLTINKQRNKSIRSNMNH